ncbi:hypothetical protein D3C71_1263790 [compost metagenome]
MSTVFCAFQIKLGAMSHYFTLMRDISLQDGFKTKLLRSLVDNRHHIEVIGDLKIGFFEQIRQNALGIRFFLEFNYNPKSFSSTLITNFSNAIDFLL